MSVVPSPSMLQAETRRERMRERKDTRDNRYDGQISSGPRQAQSFAEPEDAKGNNDDAHTKFERVFRYSGEWTMNDEAQRDDCDRSRRRSQCGRNKGPRHTPNSDHDEHYFDAFDDHGLEGCRHRQEIQATAKASVQIRSHLVDVSTIDRCFVTLRLHTGCSQYCFPQPRKPKRQQHQANKNVQII